MLNVAVCALFSHRTVFAHVDRAQHGFLATTLEWLLHQGQSPSRLCCKTTCD